MKTFFLRHRNLHLWLLCSLVPVALLQIFKHSGAVMNFLVEKVTTPFKVGVSALWYLFPFSVAELFIVILALAAVAVTARGIANTIRRRGQRLASLYRMFLVLLCMAISVYSGSCLLWGVNYYADSFQDKSGIVGVAAPLEDLYEVTAYFAEKASETCGNVARDENGVFAVPQKEFFPESRCIYGNLEKEFPFLTFHDRVPKKIFFSRFMSHTNFTGFYFAFTGEANINRDFPESLMPATIAHEMAHQRNVASENEANFVAILACTTSGYPTYEYSGYLMGYNYLSNALYREDYDLWLAVRENVAEEVRQDLSANSQYWAQYKNVVTTVTNEVYDNFLKGYGQQSGMKSYGEVVDLLIAYYQ